MNSLTGLLKMNYTVPSALISFTACLAFASPCLAQDEPDPIAERERQMLEHLEGTQGRQRHEALVRLTDFHFDHDHYNRIVEFGEQALALLPSFPDPYLEFLLKRSLLHTSAKQRELDNALDFGVRAHELAHAPDVETEDRAFVARRLGDVYRYRSEYDLALERYAEARALYEGMGNDRELGRVFNNTALVREVRFQYAEAVELYMLAREAYARAGHLSGVALAGANVATSWSHLGHYDKAQAAYVEAVEQARKAGSKVVLADTLGHLGEFHSEQNETQQALELLQQALVLYEELEHSSRIISTHLTVGRVLVQIGEDTRALEHGENALALADQIGMPKAQGLARLAVGSIVAHRGQSERAIPLLEEATAIFRRNDNLWDLALALDELAAAYAAAGRSGEAYAALEEHTALREESLNEKTQRTLAEMRTRFEAQEKEREIALLKKGQEVQAMELRRQKDLSRGLIAGSLGLLVILALLFNRYRWRARARQLHQSMEQERRVNEQLRELDQLKDQFLANTSHELRTPLFGIMGLVEGLKGRKDLNLPEIVTQQFTLILDSAHRLQRLVADVLDFSKIRQGHLEILQRPLALHRVVEEILTLVRPLAEGKDLELTNAVPLDLIAVYADQNRLEQILLNLVGNAVKFTDTGTVKISARPEGEEVLLQVRDTGIGIAPEQQERIFNAFEQADGSAERSHGGTGLGLAVSRRLVELHGGRITVESALGEGSTFSLSLPVAPETSQAKAAAADAIGMELEPLPKPVEASEPDAPRILVVDDEPVNRLVLRHQVQAGGFDVREAVDGFQALESLEGVDLVLLDVMMPRMSGYEVCRTLRQRFSPSELPVIFVSAKDRPEDIEEGLAVGGNDYLSKPVDQEELLARIRTHLESHPESHPK